MKRYILLFLVLGFATFMSAQTRFDKQLLNGEINKEDYVTQYTQSMSEKYGLNELQLKRVRSFAARQADHWEKTLEIKSSDPTLFKKKVKSSLKYTLQFMKHTLTSDQNKAFYKDNHSYFTEIQLLVGDGRSRGRK